jgi:IclR family KDG regulon transcriptional repressor
MNKKRHYHPPAIHRAVRLLNYLAEHHDASTLSELARILGYSKSSLLGILRVLEAEDWVRRDESQRGYRLGRGLLELARQAFGLWELPTVARPLMERAAERFGESVFLGRRQGDRVVILACVEGRSEMRVTSPPGTTLPLLAAATGKVFLAGMDPEEARKKLNESPLSRFTDRSIQTPEAFLAEVARTRKLGYALDDEEYLRGIRAVAVPVRRGESTVAALWVVGFLSNLTDEKMLRAAQELVDAAGILSRLLETRDRGGQS